MFRYSSTLVYLAIVLGLFCYLVFVDKKVPGTEAQEEASAHIFELNPDDVIGLEITNLHGFFFFQKINDHWELRKPVETPADGAKVDSVINQISVAQPQRIIQVDGSSDKDTDNLKIWGLIPPAERVIIHTKDKQYELLVGRKMAINDNVYARASGRKNEPVRIIPSTVKDALQSDLSAFRSRNVFDFDMEKVTQIATHIADTPTTPGQQYELDFKDGKWSLQLPLVARANTPDVMTLLSRLLGERAVDFVSDDASNLSTYGLASPTATISITQQSAEPMVLQIGGPVPDKPDQVYAQRLKSDSIFTLTRASVDSLLKAVPDVRAHNILPFDRNIATGVSFSFGPKKGQVRSDHALWNTVGEAAGRADLGASLDILAKLSVLETTPVLKDSVTDLKPYGLDKPQGKIVIESPEFKPGGTLTLSIGKAENKLLYVRNSIEPFIYTIPDNALDFLPANNMALRDGRAINVNFALVSGVTIIAGSEPPIKLIHSLGGTWGLGNVKDRMVDTLKANRQIALFCQLQAKSWLGPDLPAYGLSKPVLTLGVQVFQAASTIQTGSTILHIGATLPDGSHAAKIEGDPTVFSISDGDFGILNSSSLEPLPKELLQTNMPSATAPATNAVPATPVPAAK